MNTQRCSFSGRRVQAFTLIELLVVITIITLLLSMLLPVMSNARAVAYEVSCAAMYRNLQFATASYCNDNKFEVPYLNTGSYASLGIAGPGTTNSTATIEANDFVKFGLGYMNAVWAYDPASGNMKVPKVFICPGIQPGKQIHSWMPGNPTGNYAVGEGSWGGNIVGFGSFLGLYHNNCSTDGSGTGSNGGMNGMYRSRVADAGSNIGAGTQLRLRIIDLKNPSDDVIFIDTLFQRGGASTAAATAWNIPHATSSYKPLGINQGFADGSVRWFNHSQMNFYYQPAYPWDRQVLTPMYVSPKCAFNNGGYATLWGWSPTTLEWYGATTPNAGGVYKP